MSLRIYETDPDSKPRPRNKFSDDQVGRFRSGLVVGKMPQALSEWRVTTDDQDVADRIADLFGGTPSEWDTEKADNIEIMTEAKSVKILIEGPKALRQRMALYGNGGAIHVCDGAYFISGHPEEEEVGDACGCPRDLQTRKEKAKKGTGPKPDITFWFRLVDEPDLGVFMFKTGSWSILPDLEEIEAKLGDGDGPFEATLALEHVEYTTRGGREVSYHRPVVEVKGPIAA